LLADPQIRTDDLIQRQRTSAVSGI